jgi:hypothetical protein
VLSFCVSLLRLAGEKRMKTKKLLEIILITCFLVIIFAACQQTGQKDLKPTPNAQTNQFTVSQAWSSVAVDYDKSLHFDQARWRNNDEVYLSGNQDAILWSTNDSKTREYGRIRGYSLGHSWKAEWNPQGTLLLSSDLLWDANTDVKLDEFGSATPDNILYATEPAYGKGYLTSWSMDGQKIAISSYSPYENPKNVLKIINLNNFSSKIIIENKKIAKINWISENQIFIVSEIPPSQSDYYIKYALEIINTDTKMIEKSILSENLALEYPSFYPNWYLGEVSPDRKNFTFFKTSYAYKNTMFIMNLQDFSISNMPEFAGCQNEFQWLLDNKTIAALCEKSIIKFFDTQTGKVSQAVTDFSYLYGGAEVRNFRINSVKNKIIIINTNGASLVYNLQNMEYINCLYCISALHKTNIYQIIIDKAEKKLISVGRDAIMIVHNLKEGATVTSRKLSQQPEYAIANSPDGNVYATSGEDGTIHLWDTATRAETGSLTGHTYNVRALSWKPNSPTLASAGWDDTVRIWDTTTQTLTTTLTDHTNYVNAVQYNPSGTELASASSDGTIKLRNPDTGETLHTLQPADSSAKVFTIAYSSDSTQIASGSDDHRVRIWNTQTQTLEGTLTGHLGAVRTVIWLNPTTLVTGGMDGRIIFWDITSQQMIQELKPNLGAVFTITATADGTQLFAGFDSGNIVSWKVSR